MTSLKTLFFTTIIIVSSTINATAKFTSEVLITGLNHPWSVVFLTDDRLLITERNGDLLLFDKGKKITLNLPDIEVVAQGQGGLLDLELHPDYRENGWIYLAYSHDSEKGFSVAIGRFRLKNNQAQNWQLLYIANAFQWTNHHFGGRITFDEQNYLYLSIGDRGKRYLAQKTDNDIGKILRLTDTGKIPKDNPFNNAIFSYGHRNPQGLIFHNGQLLSNEHGPRGGDELNIIKKGGNYGWPIVSFGREYVSRRQVGSRTAKKGISMPIHHWTPSIAPSGLAVYSNPALKWRDILLVGSLKFSRLHSLVRQKNEIEEDILFAKQFGRIRDIAVRKGAFYLLTDEDNGKLIKISTPK